MEKCPDCGLLCGKITGKPGPLAGSTTFEDCPASAKKYAEQLRHNADGLHKIACEYEIALRKEENEESKVSE